ncbi:MAG: hypothetical protein GF408_03395 [Candidatus Omnitrophica bacterium]|nr:hypothetical protein [Candidatus Omnitrophota bacterium]
MNKLRDSGGFTLTEVLFFAVISVMVIGTILSAWLYAYEVWSEEGRRNRLRVDLLKAVEQLQSDLRLSSATYISFYPASPVSGSYSAVSMPVADTDANGFLSLNANGSVDWDRTVIYHVYEDGSGNKTLRRTVFDPRDNTLDHDQRYAQLQSTVTSGTGGGGSSTDTDFLENLDDFSIIPRPATVDFYGDSAIPVKVGKTIFGWARIGPGDHAIRLEVTGKYTSSSGYAFGIDYLRFEPCGSYRDIEYFSSSFAPVGSLSTSGDTVSRVFSPDWRNDNFLQYEADQTGDYIEIQDYYDLWRDSSVSDASLDNTMRHGERMRVKLELPEDRETGKEQITWFGYTQAGDVQEGHDDDLPAYPLSVRTLISNTNLDMEGDLVRVKFRSSSENPLRIEAAYITRGDKDASYDYDALGNLDPSGLDADEYHLHQQLFFRDEYDLDSDSSTDDVLSYVCIPADSEVWSEWTAFPLKLKDSNDDDVDYFITFCVPDLESVSFPSGWSAFDPAAADCRDWQSSSDQAYYITDGTQTELIQASGTPVWSGSYTVNISSNIFVTAEIDTWSRSGTVESSILDTGLDDPLYNEVKWSADTPSGTQVVMKARSSDSQFMDGVSDWDAVSGTSANPGTLNIGSGRYVQYLAEMSTDPFWAGPGSIETYADYIDEQQGTLPVYQFPSRSGEYMITGLYSTWIDDVEIDWPGDDRVVLVSGYIARKNDYGQVKMTIDGRDIIKTLDVSLGVSIESPSGVVTEDNTFGVEPRNTGK